MRQGMHSTFQTLIQKSPFILQFSNILFVITLLQVAVFGHYYQQAQRSMGRHSSSVFQDEDLQSPHLYEKALKEIIPFSHLYFQDSAKQASLEILSSISKMSLPAEAKIIRKDVTATTTLQIEPPFEIMNSKKLILKVLAVSSGDKVFFHQKGGNGIYSLNPDPFNLKPLNNDVSLYSKGGNEIYSIVPDLFNFVPLNGRISFYPKDGNEMLSMEPDPFSPELLFVSSHEEGQASSTQIISETLQEETTHETRLYTHVYTHVIHKVDTMSEKKDILSRVVAEEVTKQKNESANSLSTVEVVSDPSVEKSKPLLKAFYSYNILSKSRLLNYWMQLTAPSENVPQAEIPYREALIKMLLSDKYQFRVTEVEWLIDPEDDEPIACEKSKLRHDFADDYIDSINWEETKYGKLYCTPCKNVHFINEKAYLKAYYFAKKLLPGIYEDQDFPH